jgi:hypothetical protein
VPNPPGVGLNVVPDLQETTIQGVHQDPAAPGAVPTLIAHTGTGTYTFETMPLPGSGPTTTQVTALLPPSGATAAQRAAVCAVKGIDTIDSARPGVGLVKRIAVRCRGPVGAGPVDLPLALSFARGVSTLGSATLNTGLVHAPKTTAASTTLTPDRALNRVFGASGGPVTMLRSSTGHYEVRLPGQQTRDRETYAVTAQGTTADCQVTRSFQDVALGAQRLFVSCSSAPALGPIDTAFDLSYGAQRHLD